MPFSLMNGLAGLGQGISQAALEGQKAMLAQQQLRLANELTTARETGLQASQQEFQRGQTASQQAFQTGLQTSQQEFQRGQTQTEIQARAALEEQRAANERALETMREHAPPDVIKILRAYGVQLPGDTQSQVTPATGAGTTTPATGTTTPSVGSATSSTSTGIVPKTGNPLVDNEIARSLGMGSAGSEQAIRYAIAQDVDKDPKFQGASEGVKAAEVARRYAIASGSRGIGQPGSEIAIREAIQADVDKDPQFQGASEGEKGIEVERRFKIASSGLGARGEVQFQRVATAATEAAQAATNIMELPPTSSSGIFAGRGQGHGLLSAAKESITNALTSQEVQDYNTIVPGIARSLATIESSGLAPPGSFTTSMDALTLKAGDSELTKMRKMAEVRQIVEKGMEVNLANPLIPEVQKAQIRGVVAQIQAAIPFTHHDITMLQRSATPGQTLGDIVQAKGLGGGGTATRPATPPATPPARQGAGYIYGDLPPPPPPAAPPPNPALLRLWGQ